jgi:hypothetical protein
MDKKLFLIGLMLIPCLLLAQSQDKNLGKINFPQAFIHAGKEFPQGDYEVVLTVKDAVPFLNVYNSKQELLFEELAIVKVHSAKGTKSHFHVDIGGMLDNEYLRIKVTTQREWLMGYFLVKK